MPQTDTHSLFTSGMPTGIVSTKYTFPAFLHFHTIMLLRDLADIALRTTIASVAVSSFALLLASYSGF